MNKTAINFGSCFFFGANPAFRYNLFIFKEKIKRIFTAIRARNTRDYQIPK